MDERLGKIKEEQVNQIANYETKNNNLNGLNEANSQSNSKDFLTYNTSPDDYRNYRCAFPNFSFTPSSRPNITDNYPLNNYNPYHIFPTMSKNLDVNDGDQNIEKESSLEDEE